MCKSTTSVILEYIQAWASPASCSDSPVCESGGTRQATAGSRWETGAQVGEETQTTSDHIGMTVHLSGMGVGLGLRREPKKYIRRFCCFSYCYLCWVFAALHGLSLAAESGGYSSCAVRPAHRAASLAVELHNMGAPAWAAALRHVRPFWTRD